jgi:hypothetical protein
VGGVRERLLTYAERHWASQGATQGETGANFYDRAMIYYVWWARTGNTTYLERAHQLALNSRAYIESKSYMPMLYLMMLDGVALHAIVTGDERSIQTVLKVADTQALPTSYRSRQIGIHWIDGRDKSRFLSILMNAYLMKRPSPNGVDYLAGARDALTKILAAQEADGAWRIPGQCEYNKPYMSGMLNDAFIRYYNSIEKDARIPAAVKKSVDYMWRVDWVPSAQAFKYLDGECSEPGTGGGTNPYADLNNLIVNGFGFVAKVTGDASYFTKGDAIFAGGVAKAWIAGGKQFNQNYTTSPRYFGLRF